MPRANRCRGPELIARLVCLVAVSMLAAGPLAGVARADTTARIHERAKRLHPVRYTDLEGSKLTLIPWQGRHVTLLLARGRRNPQVIGDILAALDRAWGYYARTVGRVPAPFHSLHGRDEIAEVPATCGAACSWLGFTGTEIETTYFNTLYDGVALHGQYDQALFYELGRNFWFWGTRLAFRSPDVDPVATGYAVLMRWESMRAERIPGGPVLDPAGSGANVSFAQGRRDMIDLLPYYDSHPTLTFASTLAQNRAPAPGLLQGTDFWSSIMWHLAARHGGNLFLRRFFHHAFKLPRAHTTAEAVANWVKDADYASCVNLRPLFYRQWGFPRPHGAVAARPPAGAVREPRGSCAHRRH